MFAAAPNSGRFQFTIPALLLAMAWSAIIAWGLSQQSELAYSVICLITLTTVLASIVGCIFATGRQRAFAAGFLIFSVGYLLSVRILGDASLYGTWSPGTGLATWLLMHVFAARTYNPVNFIAIFNLGATTALGVVGGCIASTLYTPPREPAAQPPRT